MSMPLRTRTLLVAAAAAALVVGPLCRPAAAVVEAKVTVEKVYADSQSISAGTVAKVTKETGVVEVALTEALKKAVPAERVRMKLAVPGLVDAVREGQAVLLMPGKVEEGTPPEQQPVVVHVGGRWATARRASPTAFVVDAFKPELDQTYPGSGDSLVALLKIAKEKKPVPLLSKVDPAVLTGGAKPMGQTGVQNPTAAIAGDFNGDGKVDLAVAAAGGVKVFTLDGGEFKPSAVPAPTNWPPADGGAAKATEAGRALRAAAAGAFGEKDEPAVIAVRAKGVFRELPTDAKADPKAKPPADDLHRLTGYEPKALFPAVATDAGIAAAAVAAIDVNADGRKDLVVLSGDGAVILIARGYGAFFVIARKADELFKGAAAPGARVVLAAADVDGDKREDLIAVTADGKVLVVTK